MNPLQEVANFLNRTGIGLARPAAAAGQGRPEGSMATLGGKPVQWMGGKGSMATFGGKPVQLMGGSWQPYMSEGEMARAQNTQSRPEGSMATLGGKPVQWMGDSWQPYMSEGEMARAEQARIRREAPAAPQLPPPGLGTAPIIQGTRDGVTADRTQSDEYRTQLGQYEALQKKKQYEEADALGMQIWQQKYGKTPMAGPESRNPLMQSTFGYQSFERPSYEGQAPVSLEDSFSVAANSVPAPWNRQGTMVDLNRGAPELFAKQAEKTNPMNAFSQGEGISGAVKEFLGRMGR